MEYTLDQNRPYKDCFVDPTIEKEPGDYLLYCLRIAHVLNESSSEKCYTGNQTTFVELRKRDVTTDNLLEWHIPLDVADLYGKFLSDNNSDDDDDIQFICNCSLMNRFGRYCEYRFEEGIDTIEDLINSSVEEKMKFYPKDRLLSCYELETYDERCLDYRDICDGEFDRIDGDDESHCNLIEMNRCTEKEFRCRNGLCIDRQYLFDGQGDCADLTDEQSLLSLIRYDNFQNCYKQARFDCDEHWCGREMVSCGDGQCIPWFQRFWNEHDCHNAFTHIFNCELEERSNVSIDFSITDNNGRCQTNITQFNATDDDHCLLLIKCAVTVNPTCELLNISIDRQEKAIAEVLHRCQHRPLLKYASGIRFFSPFVDAYYINSQFNVSVELDFFALMAVRVPGQLCLIGERTCQGIQVIHNGSTCYKYDEIFEAKYPFPPFENWFCQTKNLSEDLCLDTNSFFRCRTTGECISKHRLLDGFFDCLDSSDEEKLQTLDPVESIFLKDRYNCSIDGNISTAVMRHFLGDGTSQCPNGTDEMSLSINWQQQQCLKSSDFSCRHLRDLYKKDNQEEQSIRIIRFTSLCDSIWDLRNGLDEVDCQEWICEPDWLKESGNRSQWSGNCIRRSWLCNQIWDYPDGSDEYNCNYTEKYPIPQCYSLVNEEIILFNQSNQVAGNGQIDCSGGVDERMTFACNDGFPLNERFLCNDQRTCLEPIFLCNHYNDCFEGEDESEYWCGSRHSLNSSICEARRFACGERNDSGPCIPQADRCHEQRNSCLVSHRDKYMCIIPRKHNAISSPIISAPQMQQAKSKTIPPWYCDRGLVVYRYDQLICLCPPSFDGHRCEKHTHRLTVIFTLDTKILKDDLIRIVVLLINQNETIDHTIITQQVYPPVKHRLYLNYPRSLYSHLRNASNTSSVQFRLYTIDKSAVRLLEIWNYPIRYSFLPAFRLAVVLKHPNHQTYSDKLYDRSCPCAKGSQCIMLTTMNFICICPSEKYGRTGHLQSKPCPLNRCTNSSTCISYIDHFSQENFRCQCSNDQFGESCEYKKSSLSFDLYNERISSSKVHIIQLINYDLITMQLTIEEQYLLSERKKNLYYNGAYLPSIGLLKVYDYSSFQISLLYFGGNYSNIFLLSEDIIRCRDVKELNLISKNDQMLSLMKRFHRPCQQFTDETNLCFYDPTIYFCFCNRTTKRAACFLYQFNSDPCNKCLNRGRCIRSHEIDKSHEICLCPPCYHGHLCEISTEPFGFTLDSLLFNDSFTLQLIYLFLTILFFLFGLFTNTCSLLTFQRPNPRKVGVGNYLFAASILNQLSLSFLLIKMLSIVLGSMHISHTFFCKSIAYLLSVTTRTNYWLSTWITIERLTIILFPNLTVLRDPSIAMKMIILTLLIVFGMHFDELMSYTIIDQSSLCVPVFQSSILSLYNRVTTIFHHLIPFLVQVVMITLLIILAARSRARSAGRKTTFQRVLRKQFHTHRELYLTPTIIVLMLSILPQGILSFSVACIELKQWQQTVLQVTYFLSYIPPMLGFILQVLPSSPYIREFRETSIGKISFLKWLFLPKEGSKKESAFINMSIILSQCNPLEDGRLECPHENSKKIVTTAL